MPLEMSNMEPENKTKLMRFDDIPVPTMVALTPGNGGGSKLLQSFLDSHDQLYMIPAYPLMYF